VQLRRAICLILGVSMLAACGGGGSAPSGRAPAVRVSGDRIVTASGAPFEVRGVTRQDTLVACLQGRVFSDPDGTASVALLASWRVNTVRLLLNEDCWLGINGVPAASSGGIYRTAIARYVSRLNSAGIVAVLALGWGAPGTQLSGGARADFMADADHAVSFWTSVGSTFASNASVMFDLFSEPFDITWSCWLHGCTTPAGWKAAGMQQMLDALRSSGADQPVWLSGLDEGNDLSGWLASRPKDSSGQEVASFHLFDIFPCKAVACWSKSIEPLARHVPVVAAEVGSDICSPSVPASFYSWALAHRVGYLGAYWDVGTCGQGSSMLVSSSTGTPTPLGSALRAALSPSGRDGAAVTGKP
jgi:endoglucanase